MVPGSSRYPARTFRTWGGTVVAAEALARGAEELEAIDAAAEALGNTRTVCRSCYVAPAVLAAPRRTLKLAACLHLMAALLPKAGSLIGKWM